MAMKSVPPPPMFTFSSEEVNAMITTEVFMDIISLHKQGFSMREGKWRANGANEGANGMANVGKWIGKWGL